MSVQEQITALVNRFRSIREGQELSQNKLSEKSRMNRETISHWENFISTPQIVLFIRALNYLGYELVIKKRKEL